MEKLEDFYWQRFQDRVSNESLCTGEHQFEEYIEDAFKQFMRIMLLCDISCMLLGRDRNVIVLPYQSKSEVTTVKC